MLWLLPISFLAGLMAKLADYFADVATSHKELGYLATVTYGFLGGFLIGVSVEAATLFLAITVGVVVAGKIDSKIHWVGLFSLIATIALLGMQDVSLPLFSLFTITTFLDELFADFAKKLKKQSFMNRLAGERLLLEIAAFTVSVATNYWMFFFFALSFDLGYKLFAWVQQRMLQQRIAAMV